MTYTNAEHLREWAPADGGGADAAPVYCPDCGEPIAHEGAKCETCAEQQQARAFAFSRVNPPARAGELRHYTATSADEASAMLERDLAGVGEREDWSDALVSCEDCGELLLYWQAADHARRCNPLEADR